MTNPMMLLLLALGMLAGVCIKKLCDAGIRFLLDKRSLVYRESKWEGMVYSAVMAVFGGMIAWRTKSPSEAVYLLLLLPVCGTIARIDIMHRIIPNELVLGIILIKILFGVLGLVEFNLVSCLLGFVCCFILFLLPAVTSRKVGAGDIKLAAAVGFCAGLTGSLYAVALMGMLVLGYVAVESKIPLLSRLKQMAPMGPFLSGALMTVLIFM